MLPILGWAGLSSKLRDKNRIFSEMKILQFPQNDVAVNFDDVMRIAHCALNIELTQPVAILTFEWTLKVTKSKYSMQFYFVVLKMTGLKDSDQNIIIIL